MAFTTWNPSDIGGAVTLSGGNLGATGSTGNSGARAAHTKRAGKYYWETTFTTAANLGTCAGIGSKAVVLNAAISVSPMPNVVVSVGQSTRVMGISVGGISAAAGNVICHALDLTAQLYWARVGAAGNWNASATALPPTGVGGFDISPCGFGPGADAYPICGLILGDAITANFGASAFTGAVPSGFTSGWDDSVSTVNNAAATQLGAEHWATSTAAALSLHLTQTALEHWATTTSITVQAAATQMALEHWAVVSATSTQQARAMVLA